MYQHNESAEDSIGLFRFKANRKKMSEELGLREKSITYIAFEAYFRLNKTQKECYDTITSTLAAQKDAGLPVVLAEKIAIRTLENTLLMPDSSSYLLTASSLLQPHQFSDVPFAGFLGNKNDQYFMVEALLKNSGALGHNPKSIETAFRSQKELVKAIYLDEKLESFRKERVPEHERPKKLAESVRAYRDLVSLVASGF